MSNPNANPWPRVVVLVPGFGGVSMRVWTQLGDSLFEEKARSLGWE